MFDKTGSQDTKKSSIRPLFDKFQDELIAFCNTPQGKLILSKFGAKEALESYPIINVSPDGFTQLIDIQKDKIIKRSVFHPKSLFIGAFGEVLTMVDIAYENTRKIKDPELLPYVLPHFMGETRLLRTKLPTVYLTTFNPNAHPESTSVDGMVRRSINGVWNDIRTGAGTFAQDDVVSDRIMYNLDTSSPYYNHLMRMIFLFDTSSIPDTDTISASTFELYVESILDTMVQSISVVATTPASNIALATGDYGQFGTTKQATDRAVSGMSINQYEAWTLNATGLASIDKTGVTKFGIRFASDVANSEPTWSSGVSEQLYFTMADNGSNVPKLVVTHAGAALFTKNIQTINQAVNRSNTY